MKQTLYKDAYNMVFKVAILTSAVVAMAAQDSLVLKQDSLLQKLTDIASSNAGLSFGGSATSGYLGSTVKSDQLGAGEPSSETQAFTEMDLGLFARPTSDSRATFLLRLHEDWQKAYDQGLNPLLFHWASYDGMSFEKKLKFDIGDMRIAYSPLTMWTPQTELLQEPELFLEQRMKSMAYRNLDTSNARLMEGANMDYNSGAWAFADNVEFQGTIARLRNVAKKADEVFFDYDNEDQYTTDARVGLDAYGAHAGAIYVNTFDRVNSSLALGISPGDTFNFNNNSVISLQLGYDAKDLLQSSTFDVGAGVEYAMSTWQNTPYTGILVPNVQVAAIQGIHALPNGLYDTTVYVYNYSSPSSQLDVIKEPTIERDGSSILGNVFFKGELPGTLKYNVKIDYLKNDTNFQSDLAMTPTFVGGQNILNSDDTLSVLGNSATNAMLYHMRSGSLENMYYTVYQSVPLTQHNIFGKSGNTVAVTPTESEYYRLYNNYQMVQTYRNGYNNVIWKRDELKNYSLDPSFDMALPFGYATFDRTGFDLKADLNFLKAIAVNLRYANFAEDTGSVSFAEMGVGVGVDAAKLLNYSKTLKVSGSYQSTKESNGYQRTSTRMMAGVNVGIWSGLSLLADYQGLTNDLGSLYAGQISKTSETLLLAGPRIQISKGSNFTVLYGLMSNSIDYLSALNTSSTLKLDKTLITADVTVNF